MNFAINRVTQNIWFPSAYKNIIYRWFNGWDSMLPMQGKGLTPGWETKILHVMWYSQNCFN